MQRSLIDLIMDYEMGMLSQDEILELFQVLVDNGLAWTMQGHYGRTARLLIEHGLIESK